MEELTDLFELLLSDSATVENLSYDPLFDQIRELRHEDDTSLPAGEWSKAAKKADSSSVLSLTRDALFKRTKDLWLAVWLGEAQVKIHGLPAVAPVLHFLTAMQRKYWDSLYPQLEEEDCSMRAAPLSWGVDCYASLLYGLPLIAKSVSYSEYKIFLSAQPSSNPVQTTGGGVDVKAAMQVADKSFYISFESDLVLILQSINELALFCGEKYGEDGPSFAKVRKAHSEVSHQVASLLRLKREQDPDPVELKLEQNVLIETSQALAQSAEHDSILTPLNSEIKDAAQSFLDDLREAPSKPEERNINKQEKNIRFSGEVSQTWDQALSQINRCATFMSVEDPSSPTPYLLLSALIQSSLRANQVKSISMLRQAPSSDLRFAIKQAFVRKAWPETIGLSMCALASPCGEIWLDLHRYIWSASLECEYQLISASVIQVVGNILRHDDSMVKWKFDDDTPVASEETREWFEREGDLILHNDLRQVRPSDAILLSSLPNSELVPEISKEGREMTVPSIAEKMALSGNLSGSIQLLMQDASTYANSRISFQRRLQVCRICLAAGEKGIAAQMLQLLLSEIDEKHLGVWEGTDIVGELLLLLLQSLDKREETAPYTKELISRLCRIDPLRAISWLGVGGNSEIDLSPTS